MPLLFPPSYSLLLPFPAHLPAEEGLLIVLRAGLAGFLPGEAAVFTARLCCSSLGDFGSVAAHHRRSLFAICCIVSLDPPGTAYMQHVHVSGQSGCFLSPLHSPESSRISACPSLYGPSKRKAIGSPLLLQPARLLLQEQSQAQKHIHRVCSSLRVHAGSPKGLNL